MRRYERSFRGFTLNAIPNAASATVAHRPSTRVICHLALIGARRENYTPFPRRFQAGNAVFRNCTGRLAWTLALPVGRDKRGPLLVLCTVVIRPVRFCRLDRSSTRLSHHKTARQQGRLSSCHTPAGGQVDSRKGFHGLRLSV